jgi:serine/threonine-protein kinase ULK/ATG1
MEIDGYENNFSLIKAFETEVDILKRFKHKNIVEFVDAIEEENYIYVVTQYCEDGDLSEYLKENKKLSESEIKRIFT